MRTGWNNKKRKMERGTTSADNFQGVTYLKFAKGKFSETATAETEGAVSRVIEKGDNKGKTVWELFHGSVTGRLLAINTSVGKYGRVWTFKIDVSTPNKPKTYLFQTQASYGIGREILSRLKNADLSMDMKFQGYYIEKDNKEGVTIYQPSASKAKGTPAGNDLTKVGQFYKKDGEQLPKWKEVPFEGKTLYDKTEETNFLIAMIDKDLKPHLQDQGSTVRDAAPAQGSTADAGTTAAPTTFAASSDNATADDLPF